MTMLFFLFLFLFCHGIERKCCTDGFNATPLLTFMRGTVLSRVEWILVHAIIRVVCTTVQSTLDRICFTFVFYSTHLKYFFFFITLEYISSISYEV